MPPGILVQGPVDHGDYLMLVVSASALEVGQAAGGRQTSLQLPDRGPV